MPQVVCWVLTNFIIYFSPCEVVAPHLRFDLFCSKHVPSPSLSPPLFIPRLGWEGCAWVPCGRRWSGQGAEGRDVYVARRKRGNF